MRRKAQAYKKLGALPSLPQLAAHLSTPFGMMRTHIFIVFVLLCLAHCSPLKKATGARLDSLPATALQPFGRTSISADGALELISSAVHFSFSFQDTACDVYATLPPWLDHNYLQYEVDGVYQKRLRVSKDGTPLHISLPAGFHTVTIYKATEAQTGAVFIRNITARGIRSVAPKGAPLIEFIGNSITCGAAADTSEVPCGAGTYHDQHNAYLAYGPRMARALGVNFSISGVSGIGIYRNWNSNGPTMPEVYAKTSLRAEDTMAWAFEKYTPQVVSIALGTNDFSKGDGKSQRLPFDSAAFVHAYVSFVKTVQTNYPTAQIALLSSPMVQQEARNQLQNCLTAVKQIVDTQRPAARPVFLFFFKPMQARGCTGHPSVEDHALLADELTPFFKSLLSK